MSFFAEIDAFVEANQGDEALKPFTEGLAGAKAQLQEATMWLMQNGLDQPRQRRRRLHRLHAPLRPDGPRLHVGPGSPRPPRPRSPAATPTSFYATKLVVGRYYVQRILPETGGHLAKVKTGSDLMMALPAGGLRWRPIRPTSPGRCGTARTSQGPLQPRPRGQLRRRA